MNPLNLPPTDGHDAIVIKLDAAGSRILFATRLGGTGRERALAVSVDPQGNTIVAGQTASTDFPIVNAAQPNFAGAGPAPNGYTGEAFVAKIDTRNSQLIYSTFLGGSNVDEAYAIATAPDGSVYVTGYTASLDFPLLKPLQPAFGGGQPVPLLDGDAFVTKLGPSGTLLWSTFLGGDKNDTGSGIAVAANGDVFVSGVTGSANFPLTLRPGFLCGCDDEIFLAKVSSAGNALPISSLVSNGGALRRQGWGETSVALDLSGHVYVTGMIRPGRLTLTNSLSIPSGGPDGVYIGDAFVVGFDANRLVPRFSSYLGGSGNDGGQTIGTDPWGDLWVGGVTQSTNFPTARATQSEAPADVNGFVAKIRFAERSVSAVSRDTPFRATLTGAGVNPPNPSTGSGSVKGKLIDNILSCEVTYEGLSSPLLAAYLRGPAQPDADGPVLIALKGDGAGGVSGTLTGNLTCASAELSELVNGLWYVEIRTTAYPKGELRGQLLPGTNQPPAIGYVPDQTTEAGLPLVLAFQVEDEDSVAADLRVTIASSNGCLMPPGSMVVGGAGRERTLTLTPRADDAGFAKITLSVRDPEGAATETSFRLRADNRRTTKYTYSPPGNGSLAVSEPSSSGILSGVVAWSATARRPAANATEVAVMEERGCSAERMASGNCGIGVFVFFVDGRHYNAVWDSPTATVPLDTTKLANGPHELVVSAWAYPDYGDLVGIEQRWITVENFRAPVDLRPNWHELHLAVGETGALSAQLKFSDGSEEAVTAGIVFASDDPSIAIVSSTGAVTGVAPGITILKAMTGDRSAETRVFVGGPSGLPHFARNGEILMEYDPTHSLFVRTMFVLNPQELESTPGLADLAKRAGVNVLNAGFFAGPWSQQPDFASWRVGADRGWSQLERTAKASGFSLLLTGDDICRLPYELDWSINSAYGPESLRHALSQARDSGIVIGIEMVDEVNFLWGGDPKPTDGRWNGIQAFGRELALGDDAFIRLMAIMNSVSNRPPITWPNAGGTTPESVRAWMGSPEFADYATHYWALILDLRGAYFLGGFSLPQVRRNMGENVLYPRQAYVQRDKPQLALVGNGGAFYTKLGPGEEFVLGQDKPHGNGITRPKVVLDQIVYAAISGMAGVRIYSYDSKSWKDERAKAPVGRDDLQTGADSFTVGTDRWDAMSKAYNFIGQLEPVLLQRRVHAIDLGGEVVTTAREGKNGTLVLALNLSEAPARVRADLTPYYRDGEITRLRLAAEGRTEERFPGRASDELTLASGETVAWILNRPTITWPTPADNAYGTPLAGAHLNAIASVPGNFTFSPPAGTVLPTGRHTLTATFAPTAPSGLAAITEKREIEVFKATPTIIWPSPADITAGSPLGSAQLNATASVPGVFHYDPPAGTTVPRGSSQPLSVLFIPSDVSNYNRASAVTTINTANSAPTVSAIGDKSVAEGSRLSFLVSAMDPDPPAQTFTFTLEAGAPEGTDLHSSAGVFTWTPTEAQGPGSYSISVKVTDSGTPPLSDIKSLTITVREANTPPSLVEISAQTTEELRELTFPVVATDADLPLNKLTFSLGNAAPAGTSIDAATGVFHWTPTEAQGPKDYPILVRVTDDATPPANVSKTFTVTVRDVNSAPVVSDIANQSVVQGQELVVKPSVVDTDLPANTLTFSLGAGVPEGLSIDAATGVIRWTPGKTHKPGVYPVTVNVTDNGTPPLSDTRAFTIAVNESNTPPVMSAIPDQTVDELSELTFAATATDADLPAQKLTFRLVGGSAVVVASVGAPNPNSASGAGLETGAPKRSSRDLLNQPSAPAILEGATIDPITGAFRWTPTEAQGPGKYAGTLRVTDDGTPPLSTEQTFNVTVNEVNLAPKLAGVSDQAVEVGRELTFTATATDADLPANTLIFTLNPGSPDGVKITPAGAFTWTPTEAQGGMSHPIGITATDDGTPVLSDSKIFNVSVSAVQREIRVTGASVSADGKFSFAWTGQTGRTYQVQFKNSWSDTEWTNVEPPVTATGEVATFSASISDSFARFYRVTIKP